MSSLWTLITLILFLGPPASAGGSRVGNGGHATSIEESSFAPQGSQMVVNYPSGYHLSKRLTGDGVRLEGPTSFKMTIGFAGIPSAQTADHIELNPIEGNLTQLKGYEGQSLLSWFKSRGWKELPTSQKCLRAFAIESKDLATTVLVNERGQGVMIISEKSEDAKKAVYEIIKKAKAQDEDCSWI